jgi:hypothetical protein
LANRLYFLITMIFSPKKMSDQIKNNIEFIVWLMIAGLLFPVHAAYAYVDPGTGSYIIQIIIGLFFGIAYAFRRSWGTIKHWFKSRKKEQDK